VANPFCPSRECHSILAWASKPQALGRSGKYGGALQDAMLHVFKRIYRGLISQKGSDERQMNLLRNYADGCAKFVPTILARDCSRERASFFERVHARFQAT